MEVATAVDKAYEAYQFIEQVSAEMGADFLVSVNTLLRGSVITGSCTAVGVAFGGPIGAAIGFAVGGVVATFTAPKHKSLVEVIRELTPEKRKELLDKMAEMGAKEAGLPPLSTPEFHAWILAKEKSVVVLLIKKAMQELGHEFVAKA
eukprot:TRINITY_DN15656_c0_g1_i1.p1 TRINITY_DN15656_c0_g1~~TRINITY_DN15656_c0_g1_i1.p1  ORF type:complete len:148 (+),score=33.63 TRINITY_DN15656_c0_g1_i1:34-477(+)